jgi:2-methylcitrate dehydratase PrpD
MGLSVERTAAALANSASMTGGTLQTFGDGSDEWRYQPGMAARIGWISAELAAAGSVSATNAFEGRAGFGAAYARHVVDESEIIAPLGHEWLIRRAAFKRFPVCAYNQTMVATALGHVPLIVSRSTASGSI